MRDIHSVMRDITIFRAALETNRAEYKEIAKQIKNVEAELAKLQEPNEQVGRKMIQCVLPETLSDFPDATGAELWKLAVDRALNSATTDTDRALIRLADQAYDWTLAERSKSTLKSDLQNGNRSSGQKEEF